MSQDPLTVQNLLHFFHILTCINLNCPQILWIFLWQLANLCIQRWKDYFSIFGHSLF